MQLPYGFAERLTLDMSLKIGGSGHLTIMSGSSDRLEASGRGKPRKVRVRAGPPLNRLRTKA